MRTSQPWGWMLASLLVLAAPSLAQAAPPDTLVVLDPSAKVYARETDTLNVQAGYSSLPSVSGTTTVKISLLSGATELAANTVQAPDGSGMTITIPVAVPMGTSDQITDIVVTVSNSDGSKSATGTQVQLDSTSPNVAITAPVNGAYLTEDAVVEGSAADQNFQTWTVDIAEGQSQRSGSWLSLGDGTSAKSGDLVTWDTTQQVDGIYTLRVHASDQAGNEQDTYANVTVDNTPPNATLTLPADGGHVRGQYAVTGSASDTNIVGWTLDVSPAGGNTWSIIRTSTASVTTGTLATWNTAAKTDGLYDLRLTVKDKVGRISTVIRTITVDNTRPFARITWLPTEVMIKDQHPINGTADDEHLASWRVERSPRGANTWSVIDSGTQPVVDGRLILWDTTGVPDNDYDLRVLVTDLAGNTSTNTISVTIDNTAPTATFAAPVTGQHVSGSLSVVGTVSDAHIASWALDRSPAGRSEWTRLKTGVSSINNGTITTIGTTTLTDGAYDLRLTAVDQNGTETASLSTIVIDNTVPEAQILVPTNNQTASGITIVSGTASDINLASWTVGYAPGSNAKAPYSPIHTGYESIQAGGVATWNTSGVNDGTYTIALTATDKAGNSKTHTVTVKVNNVPPGVTVREPLPGAVVSGKVPIAFSVGGGNSPSYHITVRSADTDDVSTITNAWDTKDFPDGRYEIRIEATATTGLTAMEVVPVTVDNKPPTLVAQSTNLTDWVTRLDLPLTVKYAMVDAYPGDVKLQIITPEEKVLSELSSTAIAGEMSLVWPKLKDGRYVLRLLATDKAGNKMIRTVSAFGVQTSKLTPPELAAIPKQLNKAAVLDWSTKPGTSSVGIMEYQIYRSVNDADWELIAGTDQTRWTEEKIVDGKNTYRVDLVSASGMVAASKTVTTFYRTYLPEVVLNWYPTMTTKTKIDLAWEEVLGASGYEVFRLGPDGKTQVAKNLKKPLYADAVKAGAIYSYQIVAFDAMGNKSVNETSHIVVVPEKEQRSPVTNGLPVLVALDGRLIGGDVRPFIRDNRTWVPVRFVSEQLGATVEWNQATEQATIKRKDGLVLTVSIGSQELVVTDSRGGQEVVPMDVAAFVENNRTYVPLRFLAEALGFAVTWDDAASLAEITTTPVVNPGKPAISK